MHSKKPILYYSSKDIKELINDHTITLPKIRWALVERMGLKNCKYSNPYQTYEITATFGTDTDVVDTKMKTSIYYTITASSVFDVEKIIELFKIEEILEMEKIEIKEHGKSKFWKKLDSRNKHLLRKIKAFEPRADNALEILINDCSSLSEAYNASSELNI